MLENALAHARYIVASYKTKQSKVLCLKFTYENLLLGVALKEE